MTTEKAVCERCFEYKEGGQNHRVVDMVYGRGNLYVCDRCVKSPLVREIEA